MKRWSKWGIAALAVAVALIIAGRVVISQQPVPPIPMPSPFVQLFENARPHLEEALGHKLDSAPPISYAVTAAELLRSPDGDLDAHIRWHFPQLQGETLVRTRELSRQIVNAASVAHYAEASQVTFIVPENLAKIAAWNPELTGVNSEAFLQLAIVHEVVRWDLDRHYHIAKLRQNCRDAEEFHALQAIVEGRAQWVTRQVAVKLGSHALFPLLATRYAHVPDQALDPSVKAVAQTALHARHRACTQGLAFWDALTMPNAEALVFAHLPRQQTVIARPDRWVEAVAKNQPDLVSVLEPLETALPAAEWQPTQQTWTPAMLTQVAAMFGAPKERAEKIAKSWYEGRSLIWMERQQPFRQVALSVVRHDGDAGARAYFGFAVDLQRKQDTLPPGTCGPVMRVIESKSTTVKMEEFDEAVRNDKRIAFGDAEAMPVSLLLARRGNLVIECTWHGQSADAALAERLVQAVRVAAH